jgi:hypothetical protein
MRRFPVLRFRSRMEPMSGEGSDSPERLVLQLYLLSVVRMEQSPGLKAQQNFDLFRGLKPPAPSGICDLQL